MTWNKYFEIVCSEICVSSIDSTLCFFFPRIYELGFDFVAKALLFIISVTKYLVISIQHV